MQMLNGNGLLVSVPAEVLKRNIELIRKNLTENCYQDQLPAKLICVTKNVSTSVINDLAELGEHDVAESRVQIAMKKLPLLPQETNLHWIGRLQTNKVRYMIDHVTMLHSLDRPELAKEADRRLAERGMTLDCLIQVNIAGEEQKGGISPEEVRPFLRMLRDYPAIRIRGLMAIMPVADDEVLIPLFRGMRTLFDQLRLEALNGVSMDELSMGMSRDYVLAARAGATMVRVGSALYQA